jgi:hypothetical protein
MWKSSRRFSITARKLDFNCRRAERVDQSSAVAAVRPSMEALNVRLGNIVGSPRGDRVRSRSHSAIWNLMSMRSSFSRKGWRHRGSAKNTPDWAHIRINVTGLRMKPEILPHIFDQFQHTERFGDRTTVLAWVCRSAVYCRAPRRDGPRGKPAGRGRRTRFRGSSVLRRSI